MIARAGRRHRTVLLDVPDEAKPALVQCADEALVVAAVSQRAPRRADAGAQRRVRNGAALPDRVDQFVLADDAIPIADEMNEQIENLRLDMNDRAGAAQLVARDINLEIGEAEVQSSPVAETASRRQAVTRQIVIGGDGSGCTIPYTENLQGISTEIQDGLEFDFKSVISSAPKHTDRACGTH